MFNRKHSVTTAGVMIMLYAEVIDLCFSFYPDKILRFYFLTNFVQFFIYWSLNIGRSENDAYQKKKKHFSLKLNGFYGQAGILYSTTIAIDVYIMRLSNNVKCGFDEASQLAKQDQNVQMILTVPWCIS